MTTAFRDDMIAAGEALYGARWQTQLARDLGVTVRQVQRWTSGGRVPRREAAMREIISNALVVRAGQIAMLMGRGED